MWCLGQGRLPPRCLGRRNHTLSEKPDVCPSIALALEQLQAVDMALDGTVAPGEGQPGFDRREFFVQALGEACERLHPARRRLRHPRLQGVAPGLPHKRPKRLAQRTGLRQRWVHLGELIHIQIAFR
jgi:hypothetical protein